MAPSSRRSWTLFLTVTLEAVPLSLSTSRVIWEMFMGPLRASEFRMIRENRVLIVDDHEMVRSGLRSFLRAYPDLELAGEAANGSQAIALCAQAAPDVILMDMVMPDMDGGEATRKILRSHPDIHVIAITSFQEGDLVERALQAGAISYLMKDVSAAQLAEAIRAAHAGRSILAPEAAQALIQGSRQAASPDDGLTRREREVLALLAEGLSNPEIAGRLVISRPTVVFHVSNILAKLGAANRAEAVAQAYKQGLLG